MNMGGKNCSVPTQSVRPKILNQGMKKSLSFRQTATSLKRANLATMGIQTHRPETLKRESQTAPSRKSVAVTSVIKKNPTASVLPTNVKKTVAVMHPSSSIMKKPTTSVPSRPTVLNKPAAGIPPAKQASLTRKLTLPKSPNFSSRLKERSTVKLSQAQIADKVPPSISTKPTITQPVAKKIPLAEKKVISSASTTWINPLTPEARTTPARILGAESVAKILSSPSTPIVKPFSRKSFTDVKARSSASVSFKSDHEESKLSRSLWNVRKEPSEKYALFFILLNSIKIQT